MKKMKKNSTLIRIIMAVIANIIVIALIIVVTASLYNNMLSNEEKNCWGILEDSAEAIEKELNLHIQSNLNILKLVAGAMVREQRIGDSEENLNAIVAHLNDFKDMTIFDRIDVLMENGNILLQTGEVRQSAMDFNAIAEKGVAMSGRRTDAETGKEIIRCAVPVVKDKHTVAILLGVIRCENLPRILSSSMYDGNAFVCLVDRTTGDFIMDDWHDSLGNLYEMKNRKMLPKYEHINLFEEISQGNKGVVAYESSVNGKASYMFYKPIKNFNWQLIVVAQEDAVFASLNVTKTSLGYLITMVGTLLIVYLVWFILTLRRVMKKTAALIKNSYTDSLTGLYNQNRFSQVMEEYGQTDFDGFGLIFLDLNGLKYTNDHFGHAAGDHLLRNTAQILKKHFGTTVYRVGGDEFVVLATNLTEEELKTISANTKADMNANKIEIAMGITWYPDSKSIKAQLKKADDLMYVDKRSYHEQSLIMR